MRGGFAIFALMLAACQAPPEDAGAAQTLIAPCGESRESGMAYSDTYPAVDEGQGRVGLIYRGGTDLIVDGEVYGYYRLLDCRSGAVTAFDFVRGRSAQSLTEPEFFAEARARGLMSRPAELVRAAQRGGYPLSSYAWNEDAIAEYADCACAHFYPDLPNPAAR